jgi:predicted acylesterase/phospholipase RssA
MGRYLVDGGLVNTVPVSVCREMGAGYVIGVNVVPEPSKVMCNPNKDQQYRVCESPELEETGGETKSAKTPGMSSPSPQSRISKIENTTRMFLMSSRPKRGVRSSNSSSTSEVKKVFRSRTKSPRLSEVLSQILTITEYQVAMENLKDVNLAISPDVEEIGFWQFNNAAQAIVAGEKAAHIALEGNNVVSLLGKN